MSSGKVRGPKPLRKNSPISVDCSPDPLGVPRAMVELTDQGFLVNRRMREQFFNVIDPSRLLFLRQI